MKSILLIALLISIIVAGSHYLLTADALSGVLAPDTYGDALAQYCQIFDIKVDSVKMAGVQNDTVASMIAGMGMFFDVQMIEIVPIFKIESNFDPLASSIKSAAGVGQVFPPAADLFYRAGLIHLDPAASDLFDVHTNLLFSYTIYRYERDHFGDYVRTLVAYQGGRRAAQRYRRTPRPVDQLYVARIVKERTELYGAAGYAAVSARPI